MIVEWLKFQVPPDKHALFIQSDKQIWTTVLASYPGYLSKQIWVNPLHPDELIIIIHWETLESWKIIPADVLADTDYQFVIAMNQSFPLLEGLEINVCG